MCKKTNLIKRSASNTDEKSQKNAKRTRQINLLHEHEIITNTFNNIDQREAFLKLDMIYQACMAVLRYNNNHHYRPFFDRAHIPLNSSSHYPRLPIQRIKLQGPLDPLTVMRYIAHMKMNPGRQFESWIKGHADAFYSFNRQNRGYKYTSQFSYKNDTVTTTDRNVISIVEGYRCLIMVPVHMMFLKQYTPTKDDYSAYFPAAPSGSEEVLCALEDVLHQRWSRWMQDRNMTPYDQKNRYNNYIRLPNLPMLNFGKFGYKEVFVRIMNIVNKYIPTINKEHKIDNEYLIVLKNKIKFLLGRHTSYYGVTKETFNKRVPSKFQPSISQHLQSSSPSVDDCKPEIKTTHTALPPSIEHMALDFARDIKHTTNLISKEYRREFLQRINHYLRLIKTPQSPWEH